MEHKKPHEDIFTGISDDFSFEEAFTNAINSSPILPGTDFYRFQVVDISCDRGGFADVKKMIVRIKRLPVTD